MGLVEWGLPIRVQLRGWEAGGGVRADRWATAPRGRGQANRAETGPGLSLFPGCSCWEGTGLSHRPWPMGWARFRSGGIMPPSRLL